MFELFANPIGGGLNPNAGGITGITPSMPQSPSMGLGQGITVQPEQMGLLGQQSGFNPAMLMGIGSSLGQQPQQQMMPAPQVNIRKPQDFQQLYKALLQQYSLLR